MNVIPHWQRSADFQSAVSPISNRQTVEKSKRSLELDAPAEWNSAIQQIGNLRYWGSIQIRSGPGVHKVLGLWLVVLITASLVGCAHATGEHGPRAAALTVPPVSSVPDSIREEYKLSPFYQKYIDAHGLPVVGSTNVSDYAMREATWIITHMLQLRPEILTIMGTNHARLVVMAHSEYTTDLPEQADRKPKVFQDRRSRGLGGRVCSCAEENLLCFPNDPYAAENILVHEFGHAIAGVGVRAIDPTFNERLLKCYQAATNAGLWKNTYAGSNPAEYWAESVQDWFDNNRKNDAQHNWVCTRAQLKQYDPAVAALCNEVFGEVPWGYHKPMERPAAERAHLAGYDPAAAPRFKWREYPVTEKPRILIQTAMGDIEAELYTSQAPFAVTNLLRYALDGYFRDGEFSRTLTLQHQAPDCAKIDAIEARADPAKTGSLLPPIPLEHSGGDALKYPDGALIMVPEGHDSARDRFLICVGDQSEMDVGGKEASRAKGIVVFGKVTRGMDLVRKIHSLPAEGDNLHPPLRIQAAYRLE
jgi:cyclophilin family peptidyl-prolyl cis-trans isomerase